MQVESSQSPTDRKLGFEEIFNSEQIRQFVGKQCPAIVDTYHSLSLLYSRLLNSTISLEDFQKQLQNVLARIKYNPKQSPTYICGKQLNQGYYQCYDCRKTDLSCFCSFCFDYRLHEGHMFAFIDNDSGYCDCGDYSLIKEQGICQNHRSQKKVAVPEAEMTRYTSQLSFLISLAIATFQNLEQGVIDTKKVSLLQQVTSLVIKIISNSEYYQAVVEEVLLQQINPHLSSNQEVIFQMLFKIAWSDQVEANIGHLFTHLFKLKRLGVKTIPFLLKMVANEGFSSLQKGNQLRSYFRQALCRRQIVQLLVSEETVANLVIHTQFTNFRCSNFILNFYEVVEEISPDLYAQIILLLISQQIVCQIDNFTNCVNSDEHQMSLINAKVQQIVWSIFKIVNGRQSMERNIYLRMILLESFWQIINKQEAPYFINRLFTLSALTLCNFDLNNLHTMPLQQLQELLSFNNIDKSQTLYRLFILLSKLSCLGIDQTKKVQKYDIALDYLHLYIFTILFQRLKSTLQDYSHKGNLLEEFLQKAQEGRQITSKLQSNIHAAAPLLKFVTSFIKNNIFISEIQVPCLIVASLIDPKAVKDKIGYFFKDLAAIFQGSTKLQFKQEAARWIERDSSLKQFIANQYSSLQKTTEDSPIHFHLSFNNYLCFFQNYNQKKLRFKAKLNSNNRPLFLSEKVVRHLEQYYRLIIHNIQLTHPDKQITGLFNDFIEMFINIYLAGQHLLAQQLIEDACKNQSLRALLNDANKETFRLYEEVCHESATKEKQSNARQLQIIKKKQKINRLKQKQKKALQGVNNKYEVKESENVCIICKIGKQKEESLHYLCHVVESSMAIQSILKENKSFLLFTTCGHLIHESCLLQSFQGQKNFKQSYSCFLCKKKSNLRLPLLISEIDEASVKELFQYIMTIRSLQREKQQQGLKQLENIVSEKISVYYHGKYMGVSVAQSIYNSILYQIYLYYLSHSQIFQSYMLPIMTHLIHILSLQVKREAVPPFSIPERLPVDSTIELIVKNLDLILASNQQRIRSEQESSLFKNSAGSPYCIDINHLFERLMGKQVQLRRIRQLERFNLFKPPTDLADLKRMVKPCSSCSCLYDKQLICLLCSKRFCLKCLKYWRIHVLQAHRGSCASLTIRDGLCFYEYLGNKVPRDCLYKDYLGQRYDDSKVQVTAGEYMLDTHSFEAIMIDIVMEFIEGKAQFDRSNAQRINCTAQ